MVYMEQNLPNIYIINEDGTERLLDAKKLRFEYTTGAKMTVEVNKWNTQEIVVRGYHGNKEYEQSEKGITLNIRPGGCNLIRIMPEVNTITQTIIE